MVAPAMRAIRGRLAELGLTQHDLAAALGIAQSTLNALLTGRRRAPDGFEARATTALDGLERVELAAAEARAQALAETCSNQVTHEARADDDPDALPEVLFLEDVATLLRCSPSTLQRRLKARVFPVAPIQGVDKRPRWSKAAVVQWLATGGPGGTTGRRAR